MVKQWTTTSIRHWQSSLKAKLAKNCVGPFLPLRWCHFVALCNHSCIPNLAVKFHHEVDHPGLWCTAEAARTIAAGEEMTISYTHCVSTLLADRQEVLEKKWGLTCKCVRCEAEKAFSDADAEWFCAGCEAFQLILHKGRSSDEESSSAEDSEHESSAPSLTGD